MIRSYLIIAGAYAVAWSSATGSAAEALEFGRQIRPIFQQHCLSCHGPAEQNGGLNFDDRATVFSEADSGNPPVRIREPEHSELIKRLRSTDASDRMPPDGERLSEAEINLLERWIAAGAAWPEGDPVADVVAEPAVHWSFQPLSPAEPPQVGSPDWSVNPIDRFIQGRRELAGLAAAPDASPEALIRRATYALTGLPPEPDEVRAFIAAASSPRGLVVAHAELVDRLLSQPAYGERWGRHWMDWVRYADTAGDNSDFPIPQAYLYRNYIISAFNDDLPYDRFIIEQLAGDLLPAANQQQRNRQIIATGYLAMARRFGSLVERYPWHLTIEDTIDNVSRTMLGLTVACARCHDHKFDPISTRDYYGLYGIFASTRYPFPGIELFQTQNDFVPLIPEPEVAAVHAPFQAATEKLTAELEQALEQCERQSLENAAQASRATLQEQRKQREKLDAMLLKARRAGEKLAAHLKELPPVPTAYAVRDGEVRNARIQIKGEPDRPGAEVPRKFPDILGGHVLPDQVASKSSGRLQLAHWIASPNNPLTARVIVNRIWQRHFGSGLVASASDFGLRGEQPTHPKLLDWLAGELIRNGWSIKHLHRLIMNSHTYRLSSQDVEENLAVDPGNHLYWKFPRQRLDAESIRDTLLWVSGNLDLSPQTEPYPIPPPAKWSYTQHHPFKDDYPSQKRSIYLMTKRLTAQPYFQTFDGPDPNVCTSDRDQSVTALQALYFVNDAFLHEQAQHFAWRLLREHDSDQQRLEHAFRALLCRDATAAEIALLRDHLNAVREQLASSPDAQRALWASLTRSLMRLNEFLYVD